MAYLAAYIGQAEERHPDCSGADRIFAVLRAVSVLGSHLEGVRKMPESYGPNVRANAPAISEMSEFYGFG